jgi:hypothetical protein
MTIIESIIRRMLIEGRVDDVKKKYGGGTFEKFWSDKRTKEGNAQGLLSDEIIDQLSAGDPSGNNKYLAWMAREVAEGIKMGTSEETGWMFTKGRSPDEIIAIVKAFHKKIDRAKKKDINQYDEAEDLADAIAKIGPSKGEQKREMKAQGADLVYEDENFLLLFIKSKKASCHYGYGTQWCITQKNASHYEDYVRDGYLFYFLITKPPAIAKLGVRSDIYGKIAFAVKKNGVIDIFNSQDNTIRRPEVNQFIGDVTPDWGRVSNAIWHAMIDDSEGREAELDIEALANEQYDRLLEVVGEFPGPFRGIINMDIYDQDPFENDFEDVNGNPIPYFRVDVDIRVYLTKSYRETLYSLFDDLREAEGKRLTKDHIAKALSEFDIWVSEYDIEIEFEDSSSNPGLYINVRVPDEDNSMSGASVDSIISLIENYWTNTSKALTEKAFFNELENIAIREGLMVLGEDEFADLKNMEVESNQEYRDRGDANYLEVSFEESLPQETTKSLRRWTNIHGEKFVMKTVNFIVHDEVKKIIRNIEKQLSFKGMDAKYGRLSNIVSGAQGDNANPFMDLGNRRYRFIYKTSKESSLFDMEKQLIKLVLDPYADHIKDKITKGLIMLGNAVKNLKDKTGSSEKP